MELLQQCDPGAQVETEGCDCTGDTGFLEIDAEDGTVYICSIDGWMAAAEPFGRRILHPDLPIPMLTRDGRPITTIWDNTLKAMRPVTEADGIPGATIRDW